jgi:ketosteroid isomerase-like protein
MDGTSHPEFDPDVDKAHPTFHPDVVKAHQMYVDAINSNSTARVLDCYDKDAVVMPPDEPIFEGRERIEYWVKKYFDKYKTHWRKISKAIWVAGDYGFDQGVDFAVDTPLRGGPTQTFSVKGILIYKRQKESREFKVYRDIFNFNSAATAVPLPDPSDEKRKVPPAPVIPPQPIEEMDPRVRDAHKAYVEAINSNKPDQVMLCYDKDAAVMPPDEPLVQGHEALERWVAKYFAEYETSWRKDSTLIWTAGDCGFDQGVDTGTNTSRKDGRTEQFTVKGILIYKQQEDGTFKVFRDIWNHNSEPKLMRIGDG